MLLFLDSEFHCGTKLTIHKIFISKLLQGNNRNSVTVYLVSNDSLMCFLVYGELMTKSSRPEVFCEKGAFRFPKIDRKTPVPQTFFK